MHRFDTGGLENGVVNLVNHMPREAYRHAIVAMTEVTDFRHRIQRGQRLPVAAQRQTGPGRLHLQHLGQV